MAASTADGRPGAAARQRVADRARCWFCGSTTGPFAEPDWLFRAPICAGCQGRPRSPTRDGQPVAVLPTAGRPPDRKA